MSIQWFDAHLDLAFLAESGRDMHAPVTDCRGRYLPAAVTLPSLKDASVAACLATIFTEAITPGPHQPQQPQPAPSHTPALTLASPDPRTTNPHEYPLGDAAAAWRAGMRQLRLYHAWRDAGAISLFPHRNPTAPTPAPRRARRSPTSPLALGILIECADPIETPDQLDAWADAGVVAIGLAWWHQGRYAAGNGVSSADTRHGLTPLGRELIARMDARSIVHDLSHLNQRATDELLAATDATVIASHSNCRSLMDNLTERHLADSTIIEVGKRGGIVGVNLLSDFLDPAIQRTGRASLDRLILHIETITQLMGHRRGVGLGSDMDGGFTADRLPLGIDAPSDLIRIAEALHRRNWSDDDIHAFAWNNWADFWRL